MSRFTHRRMPVYRAALTFVWSANELARRVPRRRWDLADQLVRAASSILLNIAEGAGEFSRKDKARFYRIALRSAFECAAILDQLAAIGLLDEPTRSRNESALDEIAAMLTGLVRSLQHPAATRKRVSYPSPSPPPSS